jgi:ABC-type dipeptide/oligopeptide/nickel transport system permease component
MTRYALKRLAHLVPVLFGATVLVFALLRLAPGDAARIRLAARGIDPATETLAKERAEMGLDQPVWTQYWRWLADVSRFDFGLSVTTGKPVFAEYAAHLKATVMLAVPSLLLTVLIAVPAGALSAMFSGGVFDNLCRAASIVVLSVPSFCMGLFLMLLFAVKLRVLPSFGSGSLRHLIMPLLTMTLGQTAHYTRFIRGVILEELSKDYVRAARARGLRPAIIVRGLVLKNAAVPALTSLGMSLALMLGGSAVVEKVFSWPGAGKYLIDAILQRDYPAVQCAVIFIALFFVTINTVGDILCMIADPRARAAVR